MHRRSNVPFPGYLIPNLMVYKGYIALEGARFPHQTKAKNQIPKEGVFSLSFSFGLRFPHVSLILIFLRVPTEAFNLHFLKFGAFF